MSNTTKGRFASWQKFPSAGCASPTTSRGRSGCARLFLWTSRGSRTSFDETDETAYHLELRVDGSVAGCARIYPGEDGMWHVGRVAVRKEYRSLHLGSRMMEAVMDKIKELGGTGAVLSAQCQAVPFYQKNGFTVVSEPYLDEHCPHQDMERRFPSR